MQLANVKDLAKNCKKSYNDKDKCCYYDEPRGGAGPIPRNQDNIVSLRLKNVQFCNESICGCGFYNIVHYQVVV